MKILGTVLDVRTKESSWLMRLIGWLLRPVNPNFMQDYATTIGSRVYIPRHWFLNAKLLYEALCHERVHVLQWRRYGPLFSLSYLLPYARALWELEAYRETLQAEHVRTGTVSMASVDWLVSLLSGPAYLWAWPIGRAALRRRVERLREEVLNS